MAGVSQDQLRFAIIEYLNSTVKSETLPSESAESLVSEPLFNPALGGSA